jgi:hypothetical protein
VLERSLTIRQRDLGGSGEMSKSHYPTLEDRHKPLSLCGLDPEKMTEAVLHPEDEHETAVSRPRRERQ